MTDEERIQEIKERCEAISKVDPVYSVDVSFLLVLMEAKDAENRKLEAALNEAYNHIETLETEWEEQVNRGAEMLNKMRKSEDHAVSCAMEQYVTEIANDTDKES